MSFGTWSTVLSCERWKMILGNAKVDEEVTGRTMFAGLI